MSDDTDNVCDNTFNEEQKEAVDIMLTDQGFKKKEKTLENFKICKNGQWNEMMAVETLFSLWTRISNMKKSFHKTTEGFKVMISYLVILTNIVVNKNMELWFAPLPIVQWDL